MQDPFADVDEILMSRATDTPSNETSSARPTGGAGGGRAGGATVPSGKVVCPFCGSINDRPAHDYDTGACPTCTMSDTPATRQATRARLGPWFVRQKRNPAAPGMKFDTLMALVTRGQISAQSVVRGPTTGQFWRFAAQVKGLSREFGVCYNCATPVDKSATICPQCNRMQEPPANPDVLLENAPTAAAPVAAPAPIHREIPPTPSVAPAFSATTATAAGATAGSSRSRAATSTSPSRHEAAAPMRDEAPQRTDLLAPTRPRPQPKPRLADEGILSARDLATAFQLDFSPTGQRRRGSVRRIALVLALLAVSAGALVLIVNPNYRDGVRVWMSETSSAARGMVTGRTTGATRPPAPPSPTVEASKPSVAVAPATQPSVAAAAAVTPTPPGPLAAKPAPETKPAQPETKSAAPAPQITIAPVPSVPRNEPATRAQPSPQQAKEDVKDAPVAKVAAAPIDAAKASEQALTLWRQALDAEVRRDYAKAVEHYEAIKKLPRSTWPAGLEISLKLAKDRVK